MDLKNEDWQEVIANKPDWARFITKNSNGLFEYHETEPRAFNGGWNSDGEYDAYYNLTPECLDLSTNQEGNNFMQGGVIYQTVKLTPVLLAQGEFGIVENPNDPPSEWRIKPCNR